MKERTMSRGDTCAPAYVRLGDKKIVDIVITNHARTRWKDRVEKVPGEIKNISEFLWDRLKKGLVRPYYKNETDVFVIEDDLVVVAEFAELRERLEPNGSPLYKMIVVTFLGRMSETIELRDLKSYYSWLRHSRRMTLIKNSRKRR